MLSKTNQGLGDRILASKDILRALALFVNFFLIIMALYHLKPASRSLILESHTAIDLPYVWIGSAALILFSMPLYQWLLRKFTRARVVALTMALFSLILCVFWWQLQEAGSVTPVLFYIFVDIFGVTLVEQAWSLTDSLYETEDAKSWYGFVGTGGLLGGVAGSAVSAALITHTSLETPDLLLVAAGIVAFLWLLTFWMERHTVYVEHRVEAKAKFRSGLMSMLSNRYLLLVAGGLLVAQLVSPLVEFQFMRIVEIEYAEREARTAMLSVFFTVMSIFSIVVNLALTPLILRFGGVLAGLTVQPVLMAGAVLMFAQQPVLWLAGLLKISDRGLAYSLSRAAREMLYVPIEPRIIYEAKAWIDMFGYRMFKVLGAGVILLVTRLGVNGDSLFVLNMVIFVACLGWLLLLYVLYRYYQRIRSSDPL